MSLSLSFEFLEPVRFKLNYSKLSFVKINLKTIHLVLVPPVKTLPLLD